MHLFYKYFLLPSNDINGVCVVCSEVLYVVGPAIWVDVTGEIKYNNDNWPSGVLAGYWAGCE